MRQSYHKDPFMRFMVSKTHNIAFWAYMKGLTAAGSEKTIKQAANEYCEMFAQLDLDSDALEKGYYRLNLLCRDMNKSFK